MRVALVSCVGKKRSGVHAAENIYVSDWFNKAKGYAIDNYDNWHILSAKHHLLNPETEIEYYELYLPKTPLDYRRKWAKQVYSQIKSLYSTDTEIHVFAGESYRRYLTPLLENEGYSVTVPLKGLGIGKQLKWFVDHMK